MKILLIDKDYQSGGSPLLDLPNLMSDNDITIVNNINDALFELKVNQYNLIVFSRMTSIDEIKGQINSIRQPDQVINIIVICQEVINPDQINENELENVYFLCHDMSFMDILKLIINTAHKIQNLTYKLQNLEKKLGNINDYYPPGELILTYNHEINNPLTTILGNVQLLMQSCDPQSDKGIVEKLANIENAVNRIKQILMSLSNITILKSSHPPKIKNH
jgi:signal transduction histidine kinase